MNVAIAKSPSKVHLKYAKALKKLGQKTAFFDIESVNWQSRLKPKTDCVLWHSNDKGKFYREIHDRIYLIEKFFNLPVFPNMRQYFSFNDKIKQHEIFKYLDVKQPKTFITYKKTNALRFIKKTKYPFVLKDVHSASGFGVFLIKNKPEAEKIVEKIFSNQGYYSIFHHFYAQEFIAGLDRSLRVITIGDKVFCSYWRISTKDWKHNAAEGIVNQNGIPSSALKISEKISKKLKYHWLAYDFIFKNKKAYCLESSCNFGVKGASKLGYDVRLEQMKYMVNWLKKNKK